MNRYSFNKGGESLMPRFDQTGPLGRGPLTGRGFGPCRNGLGVGFGRGMGFGRGRRMGRCFYQETPQTTQETIDNMQAYKKSLQEEIEGIDKEIEDLKKSA